MIRRPPRSTLDRSSAASDVYKRQGQHAQPQRRGGGEHQRGKDDGRRGLRLQRVVALREDAVSYTHLRAHETVLDLVCRLLLEKKKLTTHTSRLKVTVTSHNQLTSSTRRLLYYRTTS